MIVICSSINYRQLLKAFIFLMLIAEILISAGSCKKATDDLYTDNDAPYYDKAPSVKVRSYVNRLFIDLIGREPLDTEMEAETAALMVANVNDSVRALLISKLMTNATFRDGDTAYALAYNKRIYELGKIRFLEGVSDGQLRDQASIYRQNAVSDSLGNNLPGYEVNMVKYTGIMDVLLSASRYMDGSNTLSEQFAAMISCDIYDIINMNTFNFVNACFDDLFFRFPSEAEFNTGYSMVEDNVPGTLFSNTGETKADFIRIITQSAECRQGVIIWSYTTLLARDPSSQELDLELQKFGVDSDLKALQKRILISDEYGDF